MAQLVEHRFGNARGRIVLNLIGNVLASMSCYNNLDS